MPKNFNLINLLNKQMKKYFIIVLTVFFASIMNIDAQVIRDFVIERLPDETAVYLESCGSPSQGVIVLRTAVHNLNITMSPPSALFNINHNTQRNEYVLCVQPTDRRYRVSINHPEFEGLDHLVEEIGASQAQIFRLNPRQPAGISATAEELIELGDNRFNGGNFSEAEDYYRRALAEAPDNASLLRKLAEVSQKLEKNNEAVDFLQRTIRLRPRDETAQNMLGEIYYTQGRYSEAASNFRAALDIAPNNTTYRDNLQKALNANPQAASANVNMGNQYITQGNYAEALRYFREAARLDPQNAGFQSLVRETDIRVRQQQHMDNAAEAFRTAQRASRPTRGIATSATNRDNAELNRYVALYQVPLNHVASARALEMPLTPEWQENASYYEFEYEWQKYDGDVSSVWLQSYLDRNRNTPLRPLIESRIKTVEKIFRPSVGLGLGFGAGGISNFNIGAGLKIFSCEKLVNLHVGVNFSGYSGDYFDTDGGKNERPENNKTWSVGAMQLSVPGTLQLNLVRSGRRSVSPWAVFVAGTYQFNYNIRGSKHEGAASDSKVASSEFVYRTYTSTIFSLGYTTNRFSISGFYRINSSELFDTERKLDIDFNNLPGNSNSEKLEKILGHTWLGGISASMFF